MFGPVAGLLPLVVPFCPVLSGIELLLRGVGALVPPFWLGPSAFEPAEGALGVGPPVLGDFVAACDELLAAPAPEAAPSSRTAIVPSIANRNSLILHPDALTD